MKTFVKEKFLKYLYILPITVPILVLVRLYIVNSSKRPLWFDELITYYLVTDNSFFHMLKALTDGVDNSPPFYFMVSWFWVKLFGGTVLSIRMISCLGCCLACFLVYIVLYKIYKFWPAFLGTTAVFLGSGLIYRYNFEARGYGLFMAIAALAIFLYFKACTTKVVSKKILILTALTHAAMLITHYYGFIYSVMILLVLLVRDKYLELSRRRIYLSIVSGWLVCIPWVFGFIKHLGVIKKDFWIRPPRYSQLVWVYNFGIENLMFIFIGMFIVLFISTWKEYNPGSVVRPLYKTDQNQKTIAISTFLIVSGLLIIPALSWLYSRTVRPFFCVRYFLPISFAHASVIAALVSVSLKYPFRSNSIHPVFAIMKNVILIIITVVLLSSPLSRAKNMPVGKKPSLDASIYEYPELPIVYAGSAHSGVKFLSHLFYAKDPGRYIYLLDNEVSSKKSSLYMDKEMAALGENYLPNNVMDAERFLSSNRTFLILGSTNWFEARIKNNPAYIYKTDVGEHLIFVKKVSNKEKRKPKRSLP